MTYKPLPPLEELKQVYSYDPETGLFHWLVSPCDKVKIGDVAGGCDNSSWRLHFQGQRYPAHRIAWYYHYGEDGGCVKHKDKDRMNNRISNLVSSTSQYQ